MNAPARSLRLGFAGTPEFAVPALEALAQSAHRPIAVFSQPDRPAGRGRSLKASAVKQRALGLGLTVYQPANFATAEALAALGALKLDALVVVAYGLLLPGAVLAQPRLGCFNIHASMLPRWRGAAPIQRALLAGDASTGITIMRMEAGLDTGPIIAAEPLDIGPEETAGSLHDRLAALGARLIVPALEAVAGGRARAQPQPAAGVTYAKKISKREALIDWREEAALIARRVRAFNPVPIAETRLDGVQLRIWEAAPAPSPTPPAAPGTVLGAAADGILVACGAGALRIRRMQLAGRRPMSAREFIHSRPLEGATFESPP